MTAAKGIREYWLPVTISAMSTAPEPTRSTISCSPPSVLAQKCWILILPPERFSNSDEKYVSIFEVLMTSGMFDEYFRVISG